MRIRPVFFQRSGRLRSGWRILVYVALTALFAQLVVLTYYGPLAGRVVPGGLGRSEAGLLLFLNTLLCTASLASAWVVIRFVDKRPFRELGFALQPRIGRELLQGLAAGFAMVASVFAVEAVAGWVRIGATGAPWPLLLRGGGLYLAVFAAAAALEEILARGYVFQALIDGIGRVAAAALTSVLFGVGHAMNPHADALSLLNTVVAGAWLAAAYLKTRSLWLPTALHLSWNFSMAYLFGFAVSGLRISDPLIRAEQGGPRWVTGGDYGPEGGVTVRP